MTPRDVDLIVLATATPDRTFPATATAVQANLGIAGCPAFDVQAVCTGFIYALDVADNFIRCGQGRAALVTGGETVSRMTDGEDRDTWVLSGHGTARAGTRAGHGKGAGAGE